MDNTEKVLWEFEAFAEYVYTDFVSGGPPEMVLEFTKRYEEMKKVIRE